MKKLLIITGSEHTYGSGHLMRMHFLALEFKRFGVTVQKLVIDDREPEELPLEYDLVLLDRRDSSFPEFIMRQDAVLIALDNRGKGRAQAHFAYDALPHPAMTDEEYRAALSAVLLSPHAARLPCNAANARIRLHANKESAYTFADFPSLAGRLSPRQFTAAMVKADAIACYFGQSLFEAIYLGKRIQLYPVSEYHKKLAEDLVLRLERDPKMLHALDGGGLVRLRQFILRLLQGKSIRPR